MSRLLIRQANVDLDIEDKSNIVLIVENKKSLLSLLNSIEDEYAENSLISIVDDNYKELKKADNLDLILSPFYLDINCKKNINIINKHLKLLYRENLFDSVNKIKKELEECFSYMKLDYNLDIVSDIDIVDDDIIKIMDIKLNDSTKDLLEKILFYIKMTYELRKIKIYVFLSLSNYLDDDELNKFLKNCKLLDVTIVDIETNNNNFNEFEYKKIIDYDFCLLE